MWLIKTKKRIALLILLLILIILLIRHIYCVNTVFYGVEYNKTDISDIIKKDNITGEDYELIYKSTGVSPGAAKQIIKDKNYLLLEKLNDLYFDTPPTEKNYIAFPVTAQENIVGDTIPLVPLEKGDILITFNTHTLDWRHGHCGLVLSADYDTLLEHCSIGNTSVINSASRWGRYPGFLVLRYKNSKIAEKAADYAKENLVDIDYSVFAGITDKDMSDNKDIDSHCSHIVWQAYKAVGVDIDYDRGILVTPNDIAMCDDLYIVQIYGINPEDYSGRVLR